MCVSFNLLSALSDEVLDMEFVVCTIKILIFFKLSSYVNGCKCLYQHPIVWSLLLVFS